jgi:hypothetical protein
MVNPPPQLKGNRWESFNNLASGIAALFGIVATSLSVFLAFKTSSLEEKVSALNKDFQVASIVGGLVKSLSDPKLERDLALIALRDSLTNDYTKDRVTQYEKGQNIYLVFNLAAAISDNAILKVRNKIKQSKLGKTEVIDEIEKLKNELKIATSILKDFSDLEHPKKLQMVQEKDKILQDISSLDSYVSPINKESDPQQKTAPSNSVDVKTSVAVRELISAVNPGKNIIFIHSDEGNTSDIEKFAKSLDQQKWVVPDVRKVDTPTKEYCKSTVRYFHIRDEAIASDILNRLNNKSYTDRYGKFTSINLKRWASKNSIDVPPNQMEIWFINQKNCSKPVS